MPRNEEGSGCWGVWTSSQRLTSRAFAVHEALLVAGGWLGVCTCSTWLGVQVLQALQ